MSTNRKSTERVLLAETDNIVRALKRLKYSTERRRAIYFALIIDNSLANSEIAAIRQAMNIP